MQRKGGRYYKVDGNIIPAEEYEKKPRKTRKSKTDEVNGNG